METLKLGFDSKIVCREDDEPSAEETDQQPRSISETEMNKIMAAREKKFLGQIEKKIQGMSTANKEEVQAMLEALSESGSGAGQTPTQQVVEQSSEDSSLPAGVRAELSKLHKQLGKMQEDNKRLQEETLAKETAMKLERRKHSTESMLSSAGAVRPDQCYRILSDMIKEDEEIGDAISVRTEHGDDLVPVKEYIDTFKEENPHLFSSPAKSGSGAGGGGSVSSQKSKFSVEQLRDQKFGGMSWEDYEANRDQIISDLENNKNLRK